MMNKQLCSNCKTGAESYRLDPKNFVCPYAIYHTGKECLLFFPMDDKSGGENGEGI